MVYAAALAAAAFNLVCSGTLTSDSFYGGKSVEPYRYVYRVDLAEKKWCDGECRTLHDIVDVQPTLITLSEEKIDTPRERSWSYVRVDRQTGAHKAAASSGLGTAMLIMEWDGQCEKAPFAGFPRFETKF